eukprot:CAMPEP_0197286378 /NCGR_PEP_ID=MMETSP0890-20130614/1803_1 /TAXON_ID=44058 ORGANISM="Aureoumbra lagunensis, Strain CCMP1510" /NCGR_SAMPLE_ID=MMETSP0890 /ASSEMBLY_ACC=CAM_ASM_000533 /LENGTH=238 /DNA_ID=CAMNT_0042754657 /DNA_START=129 /DNA_END=845 /DNA_ORIENTATION=+
MSSSFFNGKVAIVTGASGTIGGAIANALADDGATVFMAARRVEKMRMLEREGLHSIGTDITDENSVVTLFEHVKKKCGKIDLLINAAGIAAPDVSIEELSAADFLQVLNVNVLGSFLCAREAFRHDCKRIINIGSISSMAPRPNSAAYTASKFAIQGLNRALALDGRQRNISVGVLHPGNVASELLSPEIFKQRQDQEGLLDLNDLVRSVLLMASMPPSANVLELTIMPTTQPLVGRG